MNTPNERPAGPRSLHAGLALAATLVFSTSGACAQGAPTFGASITPIYQADSDLGSGWELGIAAAYRSFRFRLDDQGPIPDGIGENQNVPLVARIGGKISDSLSFNFFVGATLAGSLRADDKTGNRLYDVDRDPAALLGMSLGARF